MRMHYTIAPALIGTVAVAAYDCPLPRCDACLPEAVCKAPGIGVELTNSYGSIAVQHFNGSIDQIARIAGAADYDHLLRQLSRSTTEPDPSFLERWRRQLNKRLGRPATAEVGTISAMLTSLRHAAERKLGEPLDRVVVTAPQYPALASEDLEDAVEYAGLRSWLSYPLPYPTQLYTLNAAYAANGRGLCRAWKDIYACGDEVEEGEIPLETVLGITFTDTMLHASLSKIAYAFESTPDRHLVAPELGHRSIPKYSRPGDYWAKVSAELQRFVSEMHGRGNQITEIVLMGERAGDEQFATTLRNALGVNDTIHLASVAEPTWAASRGAAMYARIRQEVPWNCTEPQECETSRATEATNDEL